MRSRFRSLVERVRNDDGGFSLPFIASMLVLLLGMSAFAIDLGWFFLNGSRLQRAADSSALAGVVFLPADVGNVTAKAVDGANANGYDIGSVNGTPVPGGGPDDLDWAALADNKLSITLTSTVNTFFLKVLGMDQFTMSRTATAQYVKPVPLGAPANCIGIGQGVTSTGLDSSASQEFTHCNTFTQNFWSAINGRATAKEHGDPYGPTCNYECSGGTNPDHDQYYYFAIDVPAGQSWVDVYVYDGGFYDRSSFAETGDEDDLANSSNGGTNMTYTLYRPDVTPLIPEDNTSTVSCSSGNHTLSINSETSSSTYRNRWARICRITSVVEGIYVLRVSNGGSSIGGNNSYSLLASSSNFSTSDPVRVYSINEMSIFTNDDDGDATVYIAEVDPIHANKTLELKFFDPGETSGNGTMTVVAPPGVSGHSCSWTATNVYTGPLGALSGNTCSVTSASSGNSLYNGEWITMQIQIPANYTCTTDCFWKMNLDLNVAHDRTTWEARVIGNPVALVPNP
ncbi:MAG TPA: pilus assembly protein TadG-related protein [Acidimicrobiia bacterium]|nr:pilus assembly protein TadG-related protein [Acidimicrobiia bacterium]